MSSVHTPHGDPVRQEKAARKARGPSRVSWAWATLIVGLVLGVALVDFLLQNTQSTRIEFFSASGQVPVSVALLAAALAGAAVVIVVGVARMVQLRRGLSVKRTSHAAPRSSRDDGGGGETGGHVTDGADQPSTQGKER